MRIILSWFLVFFFTSSIFSQNKYVLNGRLDSINNGEIWLVKFYADSTVTDTSKIVNSTFSFKGKLKLPVKARLDIKDGKRDYFEFILEPTIQNISGKNYPLYKWNIKGGNLNADYKLYNQLLGDNQLQLLKLQFLYSTTNEADKEKMDSLEKVEKAYLAQKEQIERKYILDNKDSYLSAFIIGELYNKYFDGNSLLPLYNNLSASVKNSYLGKIVKKSLLEFVDEKHFKIAPEIAQKDTSGKIIKLSSFKGKYVLVDFWASWCNPCRAQNPDLVRVYNKYSKNNFTILSISYDEKIEDWKNAIKEDSLSWHHASELNWWNNSTTKTYKISSIPQNVLVSPQGKIIAKNLEGQVLEKKLKLFFNH